MSSMADDLFGPPASVSAPTYSAPTPITTQSISSAPLQQQMLAQSNILMQNNAASYNSAVQSQYGLNPALGASLMGNNLASANQQTSNNYANDLASLNYSTTKQNADYANQANMFNNQQQMETNKLNEQAWGTSSQVNEGYRNAQEQLYGSILGGAAGGASSALTTFALSDERDKKPYVADSPSSNLSLGDDVQPVDGSASSDQTASASTSDTPGSQVSLGENVQPSAVSQGSDFTEDPMYQALDNLQASSDGMGVWQYKDDSAAYDGGKPRMGPTAQALASNPITEPEIIKTDDGKLAIDPVQALQVQQGINANLHKRLKALESNGGTVSPGQGAAQTSANSANQFNKTAQAANAGIVDAADQAVAGQTAQNRQMQQVAGQLQSANDAYSQKLMQLKQKYPSPSYQSIVSKMTWTDKVLGTIGFMLGGVSQGLLHTSSNPAIDAFNNNVKGLVDSANQDYQRDLDTAKNVYGNTMQGLQAKYNIASDTSKMLGEQAAYIQNAFASVAKNATDAATIQNAAAANMIAQTQIGQKQQEINVESFRAKTEYQQKLAQALQVGTTVDSGNGKGPQFVMPREGGKEALQKIPDMVNTSKELQQAIDVLDKAKAGKTDQSQLGFAQRVLQKQFGLNDKDTDSSIYGNGAYNLMSEGGTSGKFNEGQAQRWANAEYMLKQKLNDNQSLINQTINQNTLDPQSLAKLSTMGSYGKAATSTK